MYKPRVGVLRGGTSPEYPVSLKTGHAVLSNLPREKYDPIDVFIDTSGVWHMRGRPYDPGRVLDQLDVVWNALHGAYGEDGTVQRVFETHRVPYTGSGVLGSALGMNKALAKRQLAQAPVRLPFHRVLSRDDIGEDIVVELWRTFPQPSVVKPVSGGSSVATSVVRTLDELASALLLAFSHAEEVMIEHYVRGREATVGVIEGFRGEELYVLPPIEIVPTMNHFFDYDEKYAGHAREVCPAPFLRETTRALTDAARAVHRTLGLRDYSRSDFIVGKEGVFFLEVNTLPGLTEASLIPKAVAAVGSTLPLFLDHVTGRALARR